MLGTKMEAAALLLTPPTPEGRDPPSLRPKPNPKTEKLLRKCGAVRDPETPRNSGWPTVSGQPLRCLNVIESSYGILGASWM